MGKLHKLTDVQIRKLAATGRFPDGGGLYFQVAQGGSKSWIFRYKRAGKSTEMGLGGYPAVTLATARQKATEHRENLAAGIDPRAARDAVAKPERVMTFDEAAERYVTAHEKAWRNPKTARRWRSSIRDYASPKIGKRDVRTITAPDVVDVLEGIWLEKKDTAFKLRGSIENILAWCTVKGFRSVDHSNPALWRGNLKHMLPPQKRAQSVVNHPAMPWRELPAFYARLITREALAASALRFIILTACRASEALEMTRAELTGDVWHLTRERVKEYRNRDVPLVPQALEIINGMPERSGNPYVFFGEREGRPRSLQAIDNLMERMAPGFTTHGFRSSFRDWAAECSTMPREIAELCLGHLVGSEVERAYRRSDLLAKRRELLTFWVQFLDVQK